MLTDFFRRIQFLKPEQVRGHSTMHPGEIKHCLSVSGSVSLEELLAAAAETPPLAHSWNSPVYKVRNDTFAC